jgi:hypothetical protein
MNLKTAVGYSIEVRRNRVGCAVRTMVRTAHPTLLHLVQMPDLP